MVLPSVLRLLVTTSPITHQLPVKTSITGIKEKKIRQRERELYKKGQALHSYKQCPECEGLRLWLQMVGGAGAENGGRFSEGRLPRFQKPNVKVELGLDADKKFFCLLYSL